MEVGAYATVALATILRLGANFTHRLKRSRENPFKNCPLASPDQKHQRFIIIIFMRLLN
jgi:hypothetical protein